jgi:hypothetical protein
MAGRLDDHDVLSLLEVDVTYPGWEHQTGDRLAFYVRGFTWFRDQVLNGKLHVTDCGSFIPTMKERLTSREGWLVHRAFPWDAPFSQRQFIDSASRQRKLTPKFHKGAEIILLCEVITEDINKRDKARPSPHEVYNHMRLEPALSYLHGLDRTKIGRLSPQEKDLLRRFTGQRSNEVFFDMADGHTVTHKLALRTREFFTKRFPDDDLGDVDFRFSERWKKGPSKFEYVDVGAGLPDASILSPVVVVG